MALTPDNPEHALQIMAGTNGRLKGHEFEHSLAKSINDLSSAVKIPDQIPNLFSGKPEILLVAKAMKVAGITEYDEVEAIPLGYLATAEEGKKWLRINDADVRACKSDVLIVFELNSKRFTVGVSIKQCNNKTPTNAQLYFTTATAFCSLLNRNNIQTSPDALTALKQFCGDVGYRPIDNPNASGRLTDNRRYFWEELNATGKAELENIFTAHQDAITKLLLQKAYLNDPFTPDILLHKTKNISSGPSEYALFSIDELVAKSHEYADFCLKDYSVRKGQFKDPPGVSHKAPRFGIVQMQRGGQKQHPTQLQFNLQAGYFYKI